MQKKGNFYIIIDFDSTFIQIEALDKLAEIALKNNPQKEEILKKIKKITDNGMNGRIPFNQALKERLSLFRASQKNIKSLIRVLKGKITPSIDRNKEFFKRYHKRIYIISGGFENYIYPLVKQFGIDKKHILANRFIFSKKGEVAGFAEDNFLAQEGGKAKQIKSLNLKGKVYVIGDGYTDYQIKQAGLADKFFLFCENITRDKIIKKADCWLPNLDEFLYIFKLPRAFFYPKNRIKVLLTENISKRAVDLFKNEGYFVECIQRALPEDGFIEKIREASVLGVRSQTKITKRVLNNAEKLLAIGVFNIPINQVDLKACSQKGVAVFNTPYNNSRSMSELGVNLSKFICGKIINFINTGDSTSSANFPSLQLPKLKNCHRLIHVHKNVPGILRKINSLLAKSRLTIKEQRSKSNNEIGYTITDIKKTYNQKLINELRLVYGTIKFRVLY